MSRVNEVIKHTKSGFSPNISLKNIRHSCFALPNLIDGDYSITPGYYDTFPVPLYLTDSEFHEDPCMHLVQDKQKRALKIKKIRQGYKIKCKRKNRLNVSEYRKDLTGKLVPKYVLDLDSVICGDPDDFFEGSYNWYYTNGNLEFVQNDTKSIILHTSGLKQNVLNISTLNFSKSGNLKLKKNNQIDFPGSVFEIKSSDNFTYLRQRNHINISTIFDENFEINYQNHQEYYNSIPITSMSYNPNKTSNFSISTADKIIKIFETNSKKIIVKIKVSELSKADNWSNIQYISPNEILYLSRHNLTIFDCRSQNCHLEFKDLNCDTYNCVTPSLISTNHVLLSTTHSLNLIDVRKSNDVIRKWNHLMDGVPCLQKTILDHTNTELVILSSLNPHEKRLILNSDTLTPPFSLKTTQEHLHKTKFSGEYLNPTLPFHSKINCSTTGLTTFTKDQLTYILFQNSLGDIFTQKISDNYIYNDNLRLSDNEPKASDIKLSSETSMGHVFKLPRLPIFDPLDPPVQDWQRSFSMLRENKDLLASRLLDQWGFKDYDLMPDATAATSKVTSWLYDFNDDKSILEDSKEFQESFIASQSIFNTQEDMFPTLSNQRSEGKVLTQDSVRTTKSAKHKRMSGF